MQEFYGVYRGFTPTDESAIGIGELELTLSDEGLKIRFATGLMVQEETIPLSRFTPMTTEEVASEYKAGSDFPSKTVGFTEESGVPRLLFMRSPDEGDFALIVRLGEMSSILGPTLLYSPAQVAEGLFDKFLAHIKSEAGDVFPLLSKDGKA